MRGPRRELVLFGAVLSLCPVVAFIEPGDPAVALSRAVRLLSLEERVGIAVEPAVHAWTAERPVVMGLATAFYFAAHLGAVIATACWLAARDRAAYLRFRRTFVLAQLLTVAVYLLFPVAPLRMVLDDRQVAAGGSWTRFVQYDLAAVPSGHVVFALVVGLAVVSGPRTRWRWVAAAHPVVTVLVVVSTGHHLLVDAAAAALVVGVAAAGVAAASAGYPSIVSRPGLALRPARLVAFAPVRAPGGRAPLWSPAWPTPRRGTASPSPTACPETMATVPCARCTICSTTTSTSSRTSRS